MNQSRLRAIENDDPGNVLRTPPHNYDVERALIGAILMNNRAYERVSDFLREEHFADQVNGLVYKACSMLIEKGQQANPVTLKTHLENTELMKQAGGIKYLASLAGAAVTIINAGDYGRLVYDLYLKREMIALGENIINEAFDAGPDDSAMAQIDLTEKRLYDLASGAVEGKMIDVYDAGQQAIYLAEIAHKSDGKLVGLTTGLTDLDEKLGGLRESDLMIIAARPSMGKEQALDAKILLANGMFKEMGDIKPGDYLASIDGRRSQVLGVFPQGRKQLYRITFSDGRSTEAGAAHLWQVRYREWKAARVLTTLEIVDMLSRKRYQNRLWIETVSGEFGSELNALPMHPWVLGAMIANGCFVSGCPKFSTNDPATLAYLKKLIGNKHTFSSDDKYTVRIANPNGMNEVSASLKQLGLWGKKSEHKFIPSTYLQRTRSQRVQLLQGFLDTDGWVEKFGAVRYSTSSAELARGIQYLVRSLGGLCRITAKRFPKYSYKGKRLTGLPHWICNISHPNKSEWIILKRKKDRAISKRTHRLTVSSVVKSRWAETQCIAVSHPSHLYVTDDFIVTHNTALATTMAYAAAKYYQNPHKPEDVGKFVAFFSLEMSAAQLTNRILADIGRLDSHKIRSGRLTHIEFERLMLAGQELAHVPLKIDDTPASTVSAIRTKARRLARQSAKNGAGGLGLIVIDYLQLIGSGGRERPENRVMEISAITRGLKALAKDLNVPVVALSQLSRAVEQRDDKRPQLSDLRESGTIEQDSDIVMFVYREQYYLERAEPVQRVDESSERFHERHNNWNARLQEAHSIAEVIIGKQRHGPLGTIRCHFLDSTTKFSDLVRPDQGNPPLSAYEQANLF